MPRCNGKLVAFGALAWLAAALAGCSAGDKGKPQETAKAVSAKGVDTQPETAPADQAPAKQAAPTPEPPPPPTIPKVNLSSALLATCLVQAGDKLPEAELPDLAGKTQPLAGLFGKKLTVVCFWTGGSFNSLEALGDLGKDVAEPFADKDVRVIGIGVRETPEAAEKNVKLAEISFPTLLDSEGSYFAEIATEKLPRFYLLDAAGKILWFDVEYSRSTRRDLLQAIQAALAEN